jgi:hypothetical protein
LVLLVGLLLLLRVIRLLLLSLVGVDHDGRLRVSYNLTVSSRGDVSSISNLAAEFAEQEEDEDCQQCSKGKKTDAGYQQPD